MFPPQTTPSSRFDHIPVLLTPPSNRASVHPSPCYIHVPSPLPNSPFSSHPSPSLPRQLLWWADTLGLAAFCVIGAQSGPRPNPPV